MGGYGTVEAAAVKLGTEYGTAAGSWYFDGNTDAATYAAVLAGIEEGDPEVLDTFPTAPLSGEWAGGLTIGDVLDAVEADDIDPDAREALLDAFEDAWHAAVAAEIERVARVQS